MAAETMTPVSTADEPPSRWGRLLCAIQSPTVAGHEHAAGTRVTVLEPLGDETWLVEVAVPADHLVGGYWYDTLTVVGSALAFEESLDDHSHV